MERMKSARASVDNLSHIQPLANDPVATTTQAFQNDGFASFAGVNSTCNTTGKSANHSTAQCVTVIIKFTKGCTRTSTQNSRAKRFLVELVLVTRQCLAGGQI